MYIEITLYMNPFIEGKIFSIKKNFMCRYISSTYNKIESDTVCHLTICCWRLLNK